MKFCPKCGYFVNSNTNSCPKCGYITKKIVPQGSRTKTGVVIASIVVLILGIFLLTSQDDENSQLVVSNSSMQTQDIQNLPKSHEEFVQFALNLVNDDRKKHGVLPVSLGNNSAAQNHANDMLQTKYFSHWNSDGVKPYVTYTFFGGRGGVAENIATTFSTCPTFNCIPTVFDPYNEIETLQYGMMYDDAASNWGHRDVIIDPNNTQVNFGIAFDNENFYFVQHFETNIIEWTKIELVITELKMVGKLPDEFSIAQIGIFSDANPKPLSGKTLNEESPYNQNFYDQGKLVGMILEPPQTNSYYEECDVQKISFTDELGNMECIYYEIYNNHSNLSNYIDIFVDVSYWLELDGVHTLNVVLSNEQNESVVATSITLEYLQ